MRSLFDCANAIVHGKQVVCKQGNQYKKRGLAGIDEVARGAKLCFPFCQGCGDFEQMEPRTPENERGWLGLRGGR